MKVILKIQANSTNINFTNKGLFKHFHNKLKSEPINTPKIFNLLGLKIKSELFKKIFIKWNKRFIALSMLSLLGVVFLKSDFIVNNNNNLVSKTKNQHYINKIVMNDYTTISKYFVSNAVPCFYLLLLLHTLNKSRVKVANNNSLMNRFGKVGVAIYFGYWILTGVIIYYLVVNKYIKREKIENAINKYEYLANVYKKIHNKLGDKYTDFALAYTLNSALELVRLPTFLLFMKIIMKRKK